MKITTTIYIEEEVWKEFKKLCIDRDKKATRIIEDLVKDKIGEWK